MKKDMKTLLIILTLIFGFVINLNAEIKYETLTYSP